MFALAATAASLLAQAPRREHALPDYDARHSVAATQERAVMEQRQTAIRSFAASAAGAGARIVPIAMGFRRSWSAPAGH